MKKLVNNVNEQSVKFMVCDEYFGKSEYLNVVDINNIKSLIDMELDELSNIEKEIVIRKYYFLQSDERVSKSLDLSLLKVEIIAKSAVKMSIKVCNALLIIQPPFPLKSNSHRDICRGLG